MFPSFLRGVLLSITVYSEFVLPVLCAIAKRMTNESCNYPEVHSAYFDDENVGIKQPPILHALNSTLDLNVDKNIPYQYILLSCNAPYPIEWIGQVPQHYFYSYILDDEVRSITKPSRERKNDTGDNEHDAFEKFTVRLHIGNETMAKGNSKNVSIVCQSVNNDVCGKTLVSIMKYRDGPPGNKTMLRIRVENIPLELDTKNDEMQKVNDQITYESNSNYTVAVNMENKILNCNSDRIEDKDFLAMLKFQESTKWPDNTDLSTTQLEINQTSLTPQSGVLTCTPNNTSEDLSYSIPYVLSLPKLCPNEDITLPHLYYGHNISKDGVSNLSEAYFMSLCVQNASTENIYVGDTITVTCISSIYYFAQGMRIKVIQRTSNEEGTAQNILNKYDIGGSKTETSFGPGGYRNLTSTFVVTSSSFQEIKCSAPVRRSRKWVMKTETFKPKDPIKVTFHRAMETVGSDASGTPYLICNASGDPLPNLVWNRLSDEKLTLNQTTTQFIGQTGNTSWISSNLYFQNDPTINKSLSEYFGRYICTAKNKFDTLEKVFLFDETNIPEESASVLDKVFGRTIWSWSIVTLSMIMLLGTIIVLLGFKLHKQARNLRLFTKSEIDDFFFGRPELLLDDSNDYEEMNTYAAYLPYDRHQFEIERDQLEYDPKEILGSGAYGTVFKGLFKSNYGKVEPVAIKTVTNSQLTDKTYFACLLSEIKIMSYIGTHGNVVRLVGACTKYLHQRQIFVAIEYCPCGDMLSYILKHRSTFIFNASMESQREAKNWVKKPGSNGYCRLAYARLLLSPHLLLVWGLQIAQGMSYLSSKKVIHGDLAARNILLAGDLKPKIADFGLSKQLQKYYSNYVRKGEDLVPWRWLAVEALQFMEFSIKSDVWAFGIFLWELFTLGQVPYGSQSYSETFIVSLCQGERLTRPQFASEKLYGLMLDCWKHALDSRPSFQNLETELRNMSEESERKMLMSMSASNGPSAEVTVNKNKQAPSSAVNVSRYINNELPVIHERSPYKKRIGISNGDFTTSSTKNGYVTDMEPIRPVPASHRYVKNPGLPLPPPPPANSYIDWDAVST